MFLRDRIDVIRGNHFALCHLGDSLVHLNNDAVSQGFFLARSYVAGTFFEISR
jgi:hypothetical protein